LTRGDVVEEIVNALENAKVLLLMVSEKAVTSHNVVKEVTIASERKGTFCPFISNRHAFRKD